jgi:hypothetical protein
MDITELRAFSDHALEFAKHFLREHGNFNPMFQVLSASGVDVVVAGEPPEDIDLNLAKDALSEKVRELVRERQATAVCNVGDGWSMQLDKRHPLFRAARSGRYSTEQLERMGVAKRQEVLTVTLETPIYSRVVMQFYYRNSEGAIIFRELKDADSTNPEMRPEGRFYNFFDQAKAASA